MTEEDPMGVQKVQQVDTSLEKYGCRFPLFVVLALVVALLVWSFFV